MVMFDKYMSENLPLSVRLLPSVVPPDIDHHLLCVARERKTRVLSHPIVFKPGNLT